MGLVWILSSGLVAAAADYALKRWSLDDRGWLLASGVLAWAVSALFFAFSLKSGGLLENGVLFVLVSGVAVFAMSQWLFHEPVSPRQWVGVALAVVAVLLLEI